MKNQKEILETSGRFVKNVPNSDAQEENQIWFGSFSGTPSQEPIMKTMAADGSRPMPELGTWDELTERFFPNRTPK